MDFRKDWAGRMEGEILRNEAGVTRLTLKTIFHGHYKVVSSSDLLHRLMSQDPKESAQNFLFRAIELREKLYSINLGMRMKGKS